MYGLGGGFGGMPYQSPGSAIVGGIEAGQNFMLRAKDDEDRRQQMAFERNRQDRLDAMNAAHESFVEKHMADEDQRANWKQAYEANQLHQGQIRDSMDGLLAKYNGDPKAAMADPAYQDIQGEIHNWNGTRKALMDAAYQPFVQQGIARAQDFGERMAKQDPSADPTDPDNAQELHHWASVNFKMDPANLLKASQDAKSRFETGVSDVHDAMNNGSDPAKMSSALNTIFGNQFSAGRLGFMDPMGNQITDAVVNPDMPVVPTPDGKAVMPVMQLTGQSPTGALSTQRYAPPTAGGFDHPDNQDLHSFTPQKGFDQVGQMGAVHAVLAHPDVQSNLAEAAKNPDQDNLDWAQAYTAVGGKSGSGGQIEKVKNADGSESLVYLPKTSNGYGSPQPLYSGANTAKVGGGGGKGGAAVAAKGIAIDNLVSSEVSSPDEGEMAKAGLYGKSAVPKTDAATTKLYMGLAEERAHLKAGQVPDGLGGWKPLPAGADPSPYEQSIEDRQAVADKIHGKGGIGFGPDRRTEGVTDVPGTDNSSAAAPPGPPMAIPKTADGKVDTGKLDQKLTYINPNGAHLKWNGTGFIVVPAPKSP